MGICSSALYTCLADDLHAATQLSRDDLSRDPLGWPGCSVEELASVRLWHSLLKKFQDTESAEAERKAFQLFQQCNNRCAVWNLKLETSRDEVLWGEFKRSLYDFFHETWTDLSFSIIHDAGRTGPGAAVGSKSTDMYSKLFSGDLVSTNLRLNLAYEREVTRDPTWYLADSCRATHFRHRVVRGSRLAFVPKSHEIRRSICVEPGLNMFYQLGLGAYLEARLSDRFHLKLDDQPDRNRQLAQDGSIDGTMCTIDLSSASDSMSKRLLEEVLPTSILAYLNAFRSPFTSYRGEEIELHMISSMGNGYTFPLQTIIFSCMVEAAYRFRGVKLVRNSGGRNGNFGVFGDDIIVDRKVYDDMLRLLHLAGFTPNYEKSFNEGFFRESCGREYHCGTNVRGVYIKSLKRRQDRYVAINRLIEWSSQTGIRLFRTVRYLMQFVDRAWVPLESGYDSGIRAPFKVVARGKRIKRYQSLGYYPWVSETRLVEFDDDNYPDKLGVRLAMMRNPSGLLILLLAGHLRDGAIGLRKETKRYRRRLRITPNWDRICVPDFKDYSLSITPLLGALDWKRWETTANQLLSE